MLALVLRRPVWRARNGLLTRAPVFLREFAIVTTMIHLLALALCAAAPSRADIGVTIPVAAPVSVAPQLSPKDIYQRDSPAVVVIIASGKEGGAGELGTGTIIDGGSRVLTNAHVVIDDATGQPYGRVRFYLKPARLTGDPKADLTEPHEARVAKYDRALDLAVLEPVEPLDHPPTIELGDSSAVTPGDRVVAIGHPEQGGLWTLTTGVVSTVIADLGGVAGKNAFQTDASINRGNSGGPLIDRAGRQIGVNTSMARKAPDGLTITSVNFAIRSDVVKRWLGEEAPSVAAQADDSAPSKPAASGTLSETSKPSAPAVETIVAQAPKSVSPSKPQILTDKKPYRIDDVVAAEQEMEDMEQEMHQEVEKRRATIDSMKGQ